MSLAGVAAIIAAVFWAVLVAMLCIALVKTFRVIDEIADGIQGVVSQTVPLIGGLNETVAGVNVEIARVDTIVAGVQSITATTDQMVGVVHAAVSNPMIKVAAYAAGASRAGRALRS